MRHRFVPLVFLAAACVQRPADTITTTSGGTIAPDTAVAGIALDPIEESAPLVELEVATSERAGLYVIDMSGRPVYALVRRRPRAADPSRPGPHRPAGLRALTCSG